MPADNPRPVFLSVLIAWLVPGGGHLYIGRPWPAMFVALGVLPLFVLGMGLTGWENVSPERHPFYFALHVFAGLPTAFGTLLTREIEITRHMPHAAVGALYTAVAGVLGLMAIADVWARCRKGDPELMNELAPRLTLFLLVCLAVSLVNGATRASNLNGCVRESLKSFVSLAGGLCLLVAAVELLLLVVQQQGG
jgi:hypothetical protein